MDSYFQTKKKLAKNNVPDIGFKNKLFEASSDSNKGVSSEGKNNENENINDVHFHKDGELNIN